jgi:nucleoside-diphosphate-sugar epimerase/SAM-dependent methyltransferase
MAEARYDAVADFYVTGFDSTDDPAAAALLDLLGPPAGLHILDVACGHGRMTRELARRGAGLTGIDISGVLIGVAREAERDQPLGIRYLQADVTSPGWRGATTFDAVTCSFGLSDIDGLDGASAAIAAALRPGGSFVFSILHPCFPGGKDISGSWPTTGRYYDEGRWTAGDAKSTLRRQVGASHRMLSTYLRAFRQHGMWLDQIIEPPPPPEWDAEHDADRNPVFLVGLGDGTDLLVDCICYTAADATRLLPLARAASSTVMISTKAVYADAAGHHTNSAIAPRFGGPISETQRTMAPGGGDYMTREGYGANKVAAEQVLLDSGLPVTVLRPSKIHGAGATQPREWIFVKRVLDRRPAVFLAHRGAGVDHTTAAANIAALIEVAAAIPGQRILNSADPGAPSALEISRTIARLLGHDWDEVLLDDQADQALGRHPWDVPHPIVLDMTAAADLGYAAAGDYAATVADEVERLVSAARGNDGAAGRPGFDAAYLGPLLDYGAEDRYLAARSG